MRKWFNTWSFSQKLFCVLLPLVMVTLLTVSGLEFYYSSRILEEKAKEYLNNLASVTKSKIENIVTGVENAAFFINGDDVVQSALKEEQAVLENRQGFYFLYRKIMDELEIFALFCDEVDSIHIFSNHGKTYRYVKTENKKAIDASECVGEEDRRWVVDDSHLLYIERLYAYSSMDSLGTLALDIKSEPLYDIIADIDLSEYGRVFLINEEGRIVVSKGDAHMGETIEEAYLGCLDGKESFYENVSVGGIPYHVCISSPTANHWRILLALPCEDYMQDISRLRNVIIAITAAIIFLAVLVSLGISKGTTKSIRALAQAMEEFGKGDFEASCQISSGDEIGRLGRVFNGMVKDMKELVNNAYEQELLKQEAQIKSLQMQINPHFLYNTLDSINWMARMRQADEIGDMAVALGGMMRYSLAKNSVATIGDEVESLKNYLFIQNYRYGNKMKVAFEIDSALMEIPIPKLLIQPILENAIIHGMEEKLGQGHILISAWTEGEELYICVADDGCGMTEEAVERLLQENGGDAVKGHTSIGMVNVNKRIRMVYGSDYGISVQSELGKGTRIVLHMKTEYLK